MFDLSAGQLVADKYRIDAVIGSGGMGVVVAATHVELDQKVAIKLLRDVNDEALARFQREARLLVRLKNPHVARVFDVGSLDDDTPYIIMELLEGEDLNAILQARQRLGVEEAVDHVLEACEAIAEAHSLGMIHRDLKPANLFLARGPGASATVKVLDFGVSKMLDQRPPDEQTTGGLTNEGVALGTPGYMAPEQMASSHDVDARADIFSMGAILYRLVSGQSPYKGNSIVSVLASMAMDPLPPLRSVAPDVPEAFAAVVEQCLSQDREARPMTIAALAEKLTPFASRRGRASVDAIHATMQIAPSQPPPRGSRSSFPALPQDGLGATIVRPLTPPIAIAPMQPFPPVMASQSTTAVSPRESRSVLYGVSLASFAIVLAVVAWFIVRGREPTGTTAPTSQPTTTAVPSTPPSLMTTGVTSATTSTTTPASEPQPKPSRPTSPTTKKPPHVPTHHPTDAPPNPTDVPSSRR